MSLNNDFNHWLRKTIHKCPPLYNLCLILVRDGGKFYYKYINKKKHYSEKIKELKNLHSGEKCFIVGNGPSLRTEDLEILNKFKIDCFATNKIYKIFEKTSWRPKYYVVADWNGLEEEEAYKLNSSDVVFLGDHFYRLHNIDLNNVIVYYGKRLLNTEIESFDFSEDISQEIILGATVTYTCIQIAIYMGYKEIYLLGIDHNYAYVSDSKGNIVRNTSIQISHFFNEDSSKAYADMVGMNNAFLAALKYSKVYDFRIFNSTRGGSLEVFPRISLEDAINRFRTL